MRYDFCVTAVSERADLFAVAVATHLERVDLKPSKLLVHEDVRPGSKSGAIREWIAAHARDYGLDAACDVLHTASSPPVGLGKAMRWCFRQAASPVVLYTQEDYAAARDLPVEEALRLVETYDLNHVRFNQRRTLPAKHGDKGRNPNSWRKVEVDFDGQTLCVSDHFYTQTSLWRVAPALEGFDAVLSTRTTSDSNQFVAQFNDWMNRRHGDGERRCADAS